MVVAAVGLAFLHLAMVLPVLKSTRSHTYIQEAAGVNIAICTRGWINWAALTPSSIQCSCSSLFIPTSWVFSSAAYTSVWTGHTGLSPVLVGELYWLAPPRSASLSSTKHRNHSTVEVGRDLWRSSGPTPLRQEGHPEQVALDCVQSGVEYLQRRRLHNLSGQPVPVFDHPDSKKPKHQTQNRTCGVQLVIIHEVAAAAETSWWCQEGDHSSEAETANCNRQQVAKNMLDVISFMPPGYYRPAGAVP